MEPLRPYAIGERPGGYSQLRQKPRGLFGEPAWTSLGEYRRTDGVDSRLPPGMPSDVTRIDHARPQDAALSYRPMPSGRAKAAGLGDVARTIMALRPGAIRGKLPPTPYLAPGGPHAPRITWEGTTPNLSAFRTILPGTNRLWARAGWNKWRPNTIDNRLAHIEDIGVSVRPEQLANARNLLGQAQQIEANIPYGVANHAARTQALANAQQLRAQAAQAEQQMLSGHGPGPQPRMLTRQYDYRGPELLGLGTLGTGAYAAWQKLRRGLGGAAPAAPPVAAPTAAPEQPDPNAGGLGDMVAGAGEALAGAGRHVAEHPWAYGAGLAGVGGLGLWLNHLRKRREATRRQQLQDAFFSKSGAASDPLDRVADECPAAAGVLAWCALHDLSEGATRDMVVKAASVAPELGEEFVRLFGAAAGSSDSASGVTPPRDKSADYAPAPQQPAAPRPIPGQGSTPKAAPAPPPAGRAGPAVAPQATPPAPAPTNLARAQATARPAPQEAEARAWRERLVAADRAGDVEGAARLRAAPPAYTQQGLAAAQARGAPRRSLARQRTIDEAAPAAGPGWGGILSTPQNLVRDTHQNVAAWLANQPVVRQWAGANPAQAQQDQAQLDFLRANKDQVIAARGLLPGTPAGERDYRDLTRDTVSLTGRPEDDTFGAALGRGLRAVPGAVGAFATMPLAMAADARNVMGGDFSGRWTRGNMAEVADPLTRGLGIDPLRQAGIRGTFRGLAGSDVADNPAGPAQAQSSLAQLKARDWAESAARQTDPTMAAAHTFMGEAWERAPQIAAVAGMARMRNPTPAGTTGLGSAPARLAATFPRAANAVNRLTAMRNAPGLGGLGGAIPGMPYLSGAATFATQQANRYLGTGGLALQAGIGAGEQALSRAGAGPGGRAPEAPRQYIPSLDEETMRGVTPADADMLHADAFRGLADVTAQVQAGTLRPDQATDQLVGPVRNFVAAHCARTGEDPREMFRRISENGITWDEAQGIANRPQNTTIAGNAPDPQTRVQNVMGFFQNPEVPTWQKALVGVGVPAAVLGLLSSFLGEGGMGGVLMAALGLGAAAYGAHRGGLTGGALDSVFGANTPATPPAAGAAAAPGAPAVTTAGAPAAAAGASFLQDPMTRRIWGEMSPASRSWTLKQYLANNPQHQGKMDQALWAWNSGIPWSRSAVGYGVRQALGVPNLTDEEVASAMDAYGRLKAQPQAGG